MGKRNRLLSKWHLYLQDACQTYCEVGTESYRPYLFKVAGLQINFIYLKLFVDFRRFKMKKILVGLFFTMFAMQANAATNLVINGSFEDDLESRWSIYDDLTGWTGGSDGIELRNGVAGTASDGVNFVELDTRTNSSMTQSIATVVGKMHSLTFDYMKRPDTTLLTNGIDWAFGSSNGSVTLIDDALWHTFSVIVTGETYPMLLSFSATGTSDSYGTSLDNVSVSAVPVPAAVWLFGSALVGLFGASRRKSSAIAA